MAGAGLARDHGADHGYFELKAKKIKKKSLSVFAKLF